MPSFDWLSQITSLIAAQGVYAFAAIFLWLYNKTKKRTSKRVFMICFIASAVLATGTWGYATFYANERFMTGTIEGLPLPGRSGSGTRGYRIMANPEVRFLQGWNTSEQGQYMDWVIFPGRKAGRVVLKLVITEPSDRRLSQASSHFGDADGHELQTVMPVQRVAEYTFSPDKHDCGRPVELIYRRPERTDRQGMGRLWCRTTSGEDFEFRQRPDPVGWGGEGDDRDLLPRLVQRRPGSVSWWLNSAFAGVVPSDYAATTDDLVRELTADNTAVRRAAVAALSRRIDAKAIGLFVDTFQTVEAEGSPVVRGLVFDSLLRVAEAWAVASSGAEEGRLIRLPGPVLRLVVLANYRLGRYAPAVAAAEACAAQSEAIALGKLETCRFTNQLRFYRAFSLHQTGRYSAAAVAYQELLTAPQAELLSRAERAAVFNGLGRVLSRQQEFGAAEAAYRQAIALARRQEGGRKYAAPFNNLAWLYVSQEPTSQRRLRDALILVDEAISYAGDRPEFLDTKGLVLSRLNRVDPAIHFLQRALDAKPGDADIRENLRQARVKKRELELASPLAR